MLEWVCAHLCLTLCDPMDYRPLGSSVPGISQAGMLEWVAISFSRRSSELRDQTGVSYISCIGKWILYYWSPLGRLEWVAISFSKESYHPRDRTRVS